ncbi:MAG: 5'/3'-nucleotidase SurE [Deltaproteobacteria bacterium]|nr:5'/3'-nucleotidase SurE [Deltaproteobacteria bacterium]
MRKRPLILLTNDDGIEAAGLLALERAMAALGEVWVVAPSGERSTCSHSLTLRRELPVERLGPRRWAVDGTPVDCVFVGMFGLLPRRPAVVVSGINHGPNLGTDTIYSGTVAAAREGALRGVPSVAVSLTEGERFDEAARIAAELVRRVLRSGPHALADGRGVLLNLNVPPRVTGPARLARLGRRAYPEEVAVRRVGGSAHAARIGGYPVKADGERGADTRAIAQGRPSLTPLTLDLTQRDARRRFGALLEMLGHAGPAAPTRSRGTASASRARTGGGR